MNDNARRHLAPKHHLRPVNSGATKTRKNSHRVSGGYEAIWRVISLVHERSNFPERNLMSMEPQSFHDDTIYAVSTSGGKAAIAVIRVSGSRTDSILRQVCGRSAFKDRSATLAQIFDEHGSSLDRAVVIRFFSPRSYTGEDMVEFQVTGGRAVVSGLLRAIRACPGTRPADAGEFAKRAFFNGKVDLAEIEGLASIIDAETSAQLRFAITMASGELSRQFERLRNSLLGAMAQVESMLDFSDMEDAAEISVDSVLPIVREAEEVLEAMLQGSNLSERLRDGLIVVIAGAPNVGKSTLLNFLAKRDIAIVSPFPGTTRDSLEAAVDLGGFPVTFVDTAGIREALDPIEAEGVARAIRRGLSADLVLWLSDNDDVTAPNGGTKRPTLAVRTKADLATDFDESRLLISAKTGKGIDALLARISDFARDHFCGVDRVTVGTERQIYAAEGAITALRCILANPIRPIEIVAEDLRAALHAISRISGRIEVEEVLDQIFSRLCVGK